MRPTVAHQLQAWGTPDAGMDEPVILRGLVYFVMIATFVTVRYLLDVLFTPCLVDAAAHTVAKWAIRAPRNSISVLRSCFAPLLPWVVLRIWRCWDAAIMERACLYVAALQMCVNLLSDNTLVIGRLTKRDMWPLLVPLLAFTRISSGRVRRPRRWRRGLRGFLCAAVPWLVRVVVLVVACTVAVVPLRRSAQRPFDAAADGREAMHSGQSACTDPPDRDCTTFTGQPLPCHELDRARDFNRRVMPTMQRATYREVRRAMTENGLYGSTWHVGHACPDPSKERYSNEDRGWNLFAQHAADNVRLGHCVVSCAEAEHVAALSVLCTRAGSCETECSQHAERA